MTAEAPIRLDWTTANQRHLTAALAEVRARLVGDAAAAEAARAEAGEAFAAMGAPPMLERVRAAFGLSPFERDVLLLAAGPELEGDFLDAAPTFGLALAALPDAHWSALAPGAPLRYWRLVHPDGDGPLVARRLLVDERVLHALVGVAHLDEGLEGYVRAVAPPARVLVPSQRAVAERIVATWAAVEGRPPVVRLTGADAAARRDVAASACAALGMALHVLPADALPAAPPDLERLVRLWTREAALGGGALLLDASDDGEPPRQRLVARAVGALRGPLLVSGGDGHGWARPALTFDVPPVPRAEQLALWKRALGPAGEGLNGRLDALTAQFDLGPTAIEAAASKALLDAAPGAAAPAALDGALWAACREQARPAGLGLARLVRPAATWDDLALPDAARETLRDLATHVRRRVQVVEAWGFGRGARGLGITALFAGPSGTGKTTAAEAVAHELGLDLLHVDLSQVVSKYVGETEKHLARVFDAAEAGGAVLLFDEADALFGKRSEVKDSHDRYANLEVAYLLQRMEAYRGLAVLTTNQKQALDEAFRRRLRFVVSFPFPDAALRAEIWRRVFPADTPTEGLDPEKLGRLNATGATIRNVALFAAFLAADAGEPVRMGHVLAAARRVYAGLEQPLTDHEVRGWA